MNDDVRLFKRSRREVSGNRRLGRARRRISRHPHVADSRNVFSLIVVKDVVAKKKKVEDEFNFVPPDFNEKEFIEKDLADSRIVIITTVFGIVIGAFAALATIYVSGILGFLIIVAMGYALFRFLFRALKVDISTYQRKDYLYKGGTYLITAIALWILLLNPPFAFATPPTIQPDGVKMYEHAGGTWVPIPLNNTPPAISAGEVNITAHVLSIGSATAAIYITHNSSVSSASMVKTSTYNFQYITNVTAGSYSFYILAKSSSGSTATSITYDFSVT